MMDSPSTLASPLGKRADVEWIDELDKTADAMLDEASEPAEPASVAIEQADAQADTPAEPVPPAPPKPRDIRTDVLILDTLARYIVVGGMSIAEAARRVGWKYQRAYNAVQHSQAYAEVRSRLIAEYNRTADQRTAEMFNIVADTAYIGALKQNRIVRESLNEQLVAAVADKAMDRVGFKAPERVDVSHKVELTDASAALIAKALSEVKAVDAIDLERDFGFAVARPQLDDDLAAASVGTGYDKPTEDTNDS